MCNPASFIITKQGALFDPCSDSHEKIIKQHRLDDSIRGGDFVRVEFVPPNGDFSVAPEKWILKTDQSDTPDWYSEIWAREMCLLDLSQWWRGRFITANGVLYYEGVVVQCIPPDLTTVGGDLDLRGTQVSDLGQLQSVGGDLYLEGTNVNISELSDELRKKII